MKFLFRILLYSMVMLLPELAAAQNILWQRIYNQVGYNLVSVKTADGNIVCSGLDAQSSVQFPYSFTYKVSPTGQLIWSQPDSFLCDKVVATPDSGFIASGHRIYPTLDQINFIRKVDKNGGIQWQRKQPPFQPNELFFEIIPTSDAAYMLYGTRNDSLFLEKLDRAGNRIWFKIWKDKIANSGNQIIELASGGFVLSNGYVVAHPSDTSAVIKTDALGNIQWRKTTDLMDRGISTLVQQGSITSYLSQTQCIRQLDSLGNPLRNNCYSRANLFYFSFLKRRLGGYWLLYGTNDTARNLHFSQLDANGAILTHKVVENFPYFIYHASEASDTTLLLSGEKMLSPNFGKTFLMEVNPTARMRPNSIIGTLSGSCGSDFQNWLVGATNANGISFFSRVNALNRYEIETDTGTFTIQAYPNSQHWQSPVISLTQASTGQIDSIPLRINCLNNCPDLNVDISTRFLRRCFPNDYTVAYCNRGTIPATGAYIEVKLDSLLQYLSASFPLTSRVGQLLRFNVGTVAPNECRNFTMSVLVACGDSTQLGQSICTDVRIYPDTICGNIPTWTGANIRVQATCERDSVHFTVTNSGRVPSSTVRRTTIENATILSNTPINIGANAQLHYRFPANGNTWRMSVEQEPNHPYRNQPVAVIEGCRNNLITPISTGFLQQLPLDTRLPTARTACMTLIGAYDPNDKMSFPVGYGANRQIEPNQDLEYRIRFQNTGTDTAFTVVIKDTLSNLLDATSIQPLAASHRYEWTILKNNVLQFTFPNLLLVDSFRNEPKSHGFVKFHIKQKPNVALGSKIYNSAAIYFDFNPPVITNRTMLTIGKQFILSGLVNPTSKMPMRLRNYPNPTSDHAVLELLDGKDDNVTRTFQLYDVTGRLLRQADFKGKRYEFERHELKEGFYLLRVTQQGQILGTGRIVIQ